MQDSEFERKLQEQQDLAAQNENDAAQLEILAGDTKPESIEVTDLNGDTQTFPLETFSNYKTAQVLKMLASVKNRVNITQLFSEIITLTKQDVPQLACPHCFNDGRTTIYNKQNAEILDEATGYVGCNDCARPYYLKDAVKVVSDKDKADKLNAALEAVPQLMEFAPDLLVEYAALALIPNGELRAASKKTGGIAKLLEEKREWLQFDCAANSTLRILVQTLPYIGMDLILGELGRLDQSAAKVLSSLK